MLHNLQSSELLQNLLSSKSKYVFFKYVFIKYT